MEFSVQEREETGKNANRRLRSQGFTPAVIYGKQEPRLVSARTDKAFRFIQSMQGAKKIFNLNLESSSKPETMKVLIQDYQISNVGKKLLHIDFFEVTEKTVVTIEVPVILLNDESAPAVNMGGVIQVIRRSIPIRCKVKDIPETIEVDCQDLNFGDSIHVLDLEFPTGAKPFVTGRNFTVVTVAGRMAEEVEEVGEELELPEEEEETVAEETAEESTD